MTSQVMAIMRSVEVEQGEGRCELARECRARQWMLDVHRRKEGWFEVEEGGSEVDVEKRK